MQSTPPEVTLLDVHVLALEALARVKTLEGLFFALNQESTAPSVPLTETDYEVLVASSRERLLFSLGHTEQALTVLLARLGIDRFGT